MKKIDKTINLLETIFKCIYVFHLIFSFTCLGAGNSVTSIITLLLGGLLIIYRLINYKTYIKVKGEKLLLCFLISYIVSFSVFYKYGIYDEIKVLVWMSIQFILLYAIEPSKNIDKIKKEIKYIFITIITSVTIMNFINLILLINNYSAYYNALDGNTYILGIAEWGRLYGIAVDPNYVSVVSIVAIIAAIYILKNNKNIFIKIVLILSVILQFIFIAFAQSRTALVSFIAGIVIYYLFEIIYKFKQKNSIKNILIILLKIVIYSLIIILGSKLLVSGYNYIKKYEITEIEEVQTETLTKTQEEPQKVQEENSSIEIKREENISGDISNRRFDIWYSGYEIFELVPILGIGFGHFATYAIENIPSTYIVNNDLAVFTAFHNTIIDVLVSQGIVGIIILILFIIVIIKEMFKITNIKEKDIEIVIILITICATIGCSAMFLSHIFYVNTPTTAIFWLTLGCIIYFLEKEESKGND